MHSPAAFEHLRPISTALDGIPAVAVTAGCGSPEKRQSDPDRATQFARIAEAVRDGDDLQGLTVFCSTAKANRSH